MLDARTITFAGVLSRGGLNVLVKISLGHICNGSGLCRVSVHIDKILSILLQAREAPSQRLVVEYGSLHNVPYVCENGNRRIYAIADYTFPRPLSRSRTLPIGSLFRTPL